MATEEPHTCPILVRRNIKQTQQTECCLININYNLTSCPSSWQVLGEPVEDMKDGLIKIFNNSTASRSCQVPCGLSAQAVAPVLTQGLAISAGPAQSGELRRVMASLHLTIIALIAHFSKAPGSALGLFQ